MSSDSFSHDSSAPAPKTTVKRSAQHGNKVDRFSSFHGTVVNSIVHHGDEKDELPPPEATRPQSEAFLSFNPYSSGATSPRMMSSIDLGLSSTNNNTNNTNSNNSNSNSNNNVGLSHPMSSPNLSADPPSSSSLSDATGVPIRRTGTFKLPPVPPIFPKRPGSSVNLLSDTQTLYSLLPAASGSLSPGINRTASSIGRPTSGSLSSNTVAVANTSASSSSTASSPSPIAAPLPSSPRLSWSPRQLTVQEETAEKKEQQRAKKKGDEEDEESEEESKVEPQEQHEIKVIGSSVR